MLPASLSTANILSLANYLTRFKWSWRGVSVALAYWLVMWLMRTRRRKTLMTAIFELKKRREEHFEALEVKLSNIRTLNVWQEITSLSLKDLVERLHRGDYNCVEVLHAFQKAALEAQEKTNCVCWFIDGAEIWAQKLDHKYQDVAGEDRPPLFGIPVSIKESIAVEGYIRTRGYAASLLDPGAVCKDDAAIVKLLKHLGAIPFCTTNVPQSLFSYTCSNPIYGVTTNPCGDRQRTPGGSSGGEGALVACGGSPLGIGGDVGGSIRIPAAYCGVVGFKPTSGRWPQHGSINSLPGRQMVMSSGGPICRTLDDVNFIMDIMFRSVASGEATRFDPAVAPVAIDNNRLRSQYKMLNEAAQSSENGDPNGRKLKIGYFHNIHDVPAVPASKRAVDIAIEALRSAGHSLVPIDEDRMNAALEHYISISALDGGAYLYDHMSHDIVDKYHKILLRIYPVPLKIRRILSYAARCMFRSPLFTSLLGACAQSTPELRQKFALAAEYRRAVIDEWSSLGLDGVISPVNAIAPAPPHDAPCKAIVGAVYTAAFNLIDFPGMSLPVGRVVDEDVTGLKDYRGSNPVTAMIKSAAGPAAQNGCEMEPDGLSISVQIVSLPWQEERILHIAKEIERNL